MSESKVFLDARGLNCPLPLLKMKLALNELSNGDMLEVWASDSGAERDFQSYCRQTQHTLNYHYLPSNPEQGIVEGYFIFQILKHS